jgi:drug/metabolite transporter (DMT)-like permease
MVAVWPQLAFIVFCVSVFGILFWNMGVAKLGPLNAGLFANFAPVITYLIAIAQGRRPDAAELAGAAIVLVALIANNRHQSGKPSENDGIALFPGSESLLPNPS